MSRIAPFTASSQRNRPERKQRQRNGWRAKWTDQLKFKKGTTTYIQITPGQYKSPDGYTMEWLERAMYQIQHTATRRDGSPYTSWGWFSPQEEGFCTLTEAAMSGHSAITSPRNGQPNRFFMNVIQHGTFLRVPVLENGKPRYYTAGKFKGEPVSKWEEVTSIREKKKVAAGEYPEEDVCFFRKKFVHLSFPQFRVLQEIGRKCKKLCMCSGSLSPVSYSCRSCGATLLDIDHADNLTENDVQRYGDQQIRCSHCGEYDYPKMQSLCSDCDDPQPHSFSEVIAEVNCIDEGGRPVMSIGRIESAADWKLPNGERLVLMEDGEPLYDMVANSEGIEVPKLVYTEDLEKLVSNQFDFEGYIEPKPNSYYSEILNLREGQPGFYTESKSYNNFR